MGIGRWYIEIMLVAHRSAYCVHSKNTEFIYPGNIREKTAVGVNLATLYKTSENIITNLLIMDAPH